MIDLNKYQDNLYKYQRDTLGVLPPVFLALGLSERTGETCSYILEKALVNSVTDTDELKNDLKQSIGILIAYALQLSACIGINAEEMLVDVFDGVLTPDNGNSSIHNGVPGYVYDEDSEKDPEDSGQDESEEDGDEPNKEKSVFEH